MAGYKKVPDKKTVVAIIIVAILVIAAIVGTVVFLKNRGTTEATDLASYNEQATGATQDEQETTDAQEQSGEPATQSTEEQATEGTGTTEETTTADAVDAGNTDTTDTTTAGNNQGTAGTTGSSTGTTGTTTQTTTGGTTSGTATDETTTTENIQETVITEYETNIIPERLVAEGEYKTWEETGLNAPIVDTFRNMVILVPDVEITKTATAINGKAVTINEETGKVNETVKKDDVITYTITVENTGNVILNNIEVKDDLKVDYKEGETESTVEPGNVITTIETLLPGETATIEVNYTVTQDDVDNKTEIRNVATVTGTTPSGETETDSDDDTTVPTDKTAGIDVTKTATAINGDTNIAGKAVEKDDVITYTITVENTGKVTLNDVAITDDLTVNYKASEEAEEVVVTAGNVITTIETLEPGDLETIEVNYTVTQDDVDDKDVIRNVGTATGTTPSGETETDNDDDTTVPTAEPEPEMNLTAISTTSEPEPQKAILVLDYSSSMGGNKIKSLRKAVGQFLDIFLAQDGNEVNIIEYDANIHDQTDGFTDNRKELNKIINNGIGSGTNIDLGLTVAYETLLSMTPEERATTTVILMSDGSPYRYCPNGTHSAAVREDLETSEAQDYYAEQAKEAANWIKQLQVKLYSIGFDLEDDRDAYNLMYSIASAPNFFAYAEDGDVLVQKFNEISATMTSVQDQLPGEEIPVQEGIATISKGLFEGCQNVEIYNGTYLNGGTRVQTHTWTTFQNLEDENGEKLVDFDENGNMIFNLGKYKEQYLSDDVTDVTIRFVDGQIQGLSLFSQFMNFVEEDDDGEATGNMIKDIDATKQKVESIDTTQKTVTDSNGVQEKPSVDETIPEDPQTNLDMPTTNVPEKDENLQKTDETTDTSTDQNTGTSTETTIDTSADDNKEQVVEDNTNENKTIEGNASEMKTSDEMTSESSNIDE